ncbi:unnamed protein product [Paramecium sonneborni]|uniref:Protein kinase domain-containing protein n=1 Tax=Paramecium sonneborni TaxID=65129 RepID=A0A8S1RED0_9CILI|nr:unnamed protein product [Paramecium sonneborni]
MELEKRLSAFAIEQLQKAYEYCGSEGTIHFYNYWEQNVLQYCILKVIIYKEQQEVEKELKIYDQFLKSLNDNPNLVKTLKVIHLRDLKLICILMQKCNINLQDYMRKSLTFNSILIFFHQFLNGYQSLYQSRVVHRDIKPENILVYFQNNQPIYKISDFGVSKICHFYFNTQSQVGTAQYTAPE